MSSRPLAGIAVAGQLAFIASWAVGGLAEPGYSTSNQTVSELFSRPAEHPWIVQVGLLALVASYLASAAIARQVLGPRGSATSILFMAAAPLVLLVAFSPLDCMTNAPGASASCFEDVSSTHRLHNGAAVALQLCLAATPFGAAWALRGTRWARPALGFGALAVATIGWYVAADAGSAGYGVAQRAMFGAITVWISALAAAALARDRVRP